MELSEKDKMELALKSILGIIRKYDMLPQTIADLFFLLSESLTKELEELEEELSKNKETIN